MAREHEDPRLELSIERKRHVHRHLIAVKIRIECRAHHGVDADRLSLHENRLKCLDAEPMKSRGAIEQNRMPVDDIFQNLPHLLPLLVHHLLGALDGLDQPAFDQLSDNKRLEELDGHILRQPALVEFQLRSQCDGRRRCRGNFQEHRWWLDLEEAWRRFTGSNRSHRPGDQRE